MPRQTYWCVACQEELPSQQALDKHNVAMKAKGIRGHVQCPKCVHVAADEKAKVMHMRINHPVLQNLTCPACKQGPYHKVDDFVHHIEKGHCGALTLDKIDDMRRELVLPSRAISAAQGFQQRDDFSEYFGLDRHKVFPSQRLSEHPFPQNWDDWTANPAPASDETCPVAEPVTNKGPEDDINGNPRDPNLEYDEWGRPVLPEGEEEETEVMDLLPPWKNLQPGATVVDCWNEHMGMYKCPCFMPKICLKVFPTARKLVNHIKAQHNERVYRCPCCMKGYQSLQSLAGHTTSYGQFCKFRRDELFDNFIEQLVGGMIVAERTRNEDGTRNFRISDRALKMFGQRIVPGNIPVDDGKTSRKRRGKRHQPVTENTHRGKTDVEPGAKHSKETGAPAQPATPDDELMAEEVDWDEWDRKFDVKDADVCEEMEQKCHITVKDEVNPMTHCDSESPRPETVRIPKPPRFTDIADAVGNEAKLVARAGSEPPRSDVVRMPKPPRGEVLRIPKLPRFGDIGDAVGDEGKPVGRAGSEPPRPDVVHIPKPPKVAVPRIPKPPRFDATPAQKPETEALDQGGQNEGSGNVKGPRGNQGRGIAKPNASPASDRSVPLAQNNPRKNKAVQGQNMVKTGSGAGVSSQGKKSSKPTGESNGAVQQQKRKGTYKDPWAWRKMK